MTTYTIDPSEFESLKNKTIIVTGCSSGIGRETARIAHTNLVLADWNEAETVSLLKEFGPDSTAVYRKTDVSQWDDILEVFQLGWTTFGIIHAVISNAGISSAEDLLHDEIDPKLGKLKAPDVKSIAINLVSHIYVAKCAEHYFKKWPETKCQIVFTGSAASFLDTPPFYMYCAAKTGILGLMRGLRTQLIKKNITVNMIAPWLTVTPMLPEAYLKFWGTLPANQPSGVANALLLPVMRPDINGKAFFIAGHQIVDFEDKLHETQHLWMGQQLSDDVDEGQRRLLS